MSIDLTLLLLSSNHDMKTSLVSSLSLVMSAYSVPFTFSQFILIEAQTTIDFPSFYYEPANPLIAPF